MLMLFNTQINFFNLLACYNLKANLKKVIRPRVIMYNLFVFINVPTEKMNNMMLADF